MICDLGVIFDSKLSFSHHIQFISEAAYKSLGFVIRNGREFGDVETLKTLYLSYCRSRMEYASIIWSPIYNIHIASLERIQRRFLKTMVYILDGTFFFAAIAAC